MTLKVAINGLGRIGRCIIRAICESDLPLEIVAINGSQSAVDYLRLIKYDSVHGRFNGNIAVDGDQLLIGKHKITIINHRNIEDISWQKFNIDIVFECTGKFTKRKDAEKHLSSGAKRVIISAPSSDADRMIVYGANNDQLLASDKVISIGSCTTNAIVPLAKILHDRFEIQEGYLTTVHAYTSDQNILDNSHKDPRRARAAALSMVPTATGAAQAIGQVLPELNGKLSGSAIRVPVPNVSLIDFTFNAAKIVSVEDVNQLVHEAADSNMKGVIGFAEDKLVSIDFNHTTYSTVFDPYETKVINKMVRILSWYDNEWGYSHRMLDVAMLMKQYL